MNDKALKTTYMISYQRITVSLLLSISPVLYAQQLSCNPSCSDVSGGFINEISRGGSLIANSIELKSGAPLATDTYTNVSLAFGRKDASLGNLDLTLIDSKINTTAPIKTHSRAIGLGTSTNNATVTANIVNSEIKYKSANNASGYNTIGLLMESDTTGQIYNINLTNTDMFISSDANNNMVGGIWAYSNNGFAETNITLDNSNITIESALSSAYGIRTEDKNNSAVSSINIQDINAGSIKVTGNTAAYGISIDTQGKSAYIDNKSIIEVEATGGNSSAYGIYTRAQKNTINTHADKINVKASSKAYGIDAIGSDEQRINNTADIVVESLTEAYGIRAQSNAGDVVIDSTGDITVTGKNTVYGISSTAEKNSKISVSGKIDTSNAQNGGIGIYSYAETGLNEVVLQTAANVVGASSGVYLYGNTGDQQLTLQQGSQLSSKNDMALLSYSTAGDLTVNNNGRIIGYVDLYSGGEITFNNQTSGVLELKNITSTGVKNDIYYKTYSGVSSTLNNSGLIKFADENFDGTPTHAEFNVSTFNNAGVIDISGKNPTGANTQVGDTFTINGDYVSQGGSIYLNTLLDDASSGTGNGTSDLITITGDVTTGIGGTTKLMVTPTSDSLGALTTGEGIKIVQINGSTSSNAFALGKPLVSGAYEYTLHQGQADTSWYLSSFARAVSGSTGNIQYNPALGAYLANQTAAVQMFQQTLFDRLVSSSDITNDASKSLFWMRTKITHSNYESVHGNLSNRTSSYSLQVGGDLEVWALNNGGYFHLGVMGGDGDFKNTSKSDLTGTKAEGKVKGYTVGVYGTYFANQDTNLGLYVDLWSQMGWYRNEVSGEAQIDTKKYNSKVWSNSIELGYGMPLSVSGDYEWLATPHAQFTYNYYDADNQNDKNNLYVSNNNASGLDTRLGLRFHARGIKDNLIEPFLEMNWLNTNAKNRLDFNGKTLTDGFAKDRFEAKVGLKGNINKSWSMSAQLGGQWGNSYNSYQGQLNLNYKF